MALVSKSIFSRYFIDDKTPSAIHFERVQAHRSNRTALVVDPSGAVEIFMRYAGVRLVDAEQLFAQVSSGVSSASTPAGDTQSGPKTRASALQELRAAAADCMIHGQTLVLRMGVTPVDFRSVVCARLIHNMRTHYFLHQ